MSSLWRDTSHDNILPPPACDYSSLFFLGSEHDCRWLPLHNITGKGKIRGLIIVGEGSSKRSRDRLKTKQLSRYRKGKGEQKFTKTLHKSGKRTEPQPNQQVIISFAHPVLPPGKRSKHRGGGEEAAKVRALSLCQECAELSKEGKR